MLGKNFSIQHFEIFYFSHKIRFDSLCKLTPKGQALFSKETKEIIFMKVKSYFQGKIRKISSVCHLLNLPIVCQVLSKVRFSIITAQTKNTIKPSNYQILKARAQTRLHTCAECSESSLFII